MKKGHGVAVILLFSTMFALLINLPPAAAQEGCCVLQSGCESSPNQGACSGQFFNLPCAELTTCNIGCCCGAPPGDIVGTRNACIVPGANFVSLSPFDPAFEQQLTEEQCNQQYCQQQVPSCTQNSCESPVGQDCLCGNSEINAGAYCCAADNAGFNNQNECRQSANCQPAPVQTYRVTGMVRLGTPSGQGIPGVTVTLGAMVAISQSDGSFTFNAVPAGTYTLLGTRNGYRQTNVITVTVTNQDVQAEDILMVQQELDTDYDGAANSQDLCPYEPAIITGGEVEYTPGREQICGDLIDNDCDGNTYLGTNGPHTNIADCNDVDCINSPACASQQIGRCGDNVIQFLSDVGYAEQCDGTAENQCVYGCDTATCLCRMSACPADAQCQNDGDCQQNEVCTNCQCVSTIPAVCGDGQVTSYEECDVGADPDNWEDDFDTFDEGALQNCEGFCGPLGANGEARPNACSCLLEQTCGNGVIEGTEQCDNSACPASGTCTDQCACSYQCEENPVSPTNLALDGSSFAAVRLTWALESACQLQRYNIYRCVGDRCERNFEENRVLLGTGPPANTQYDDDQVEPEMHYCYQIGAYYASGIETLSDVQCVDTADQFCFDHPGEFCFENAGHRCANDGSFSPILGKDCNTFAGAEQGEYVCITKDNVASCIFQSICDECNGVFGLFWPTGRAEWDDPSRNLPPGVVDCSDIATCFLDVTLTSQDQYNACLGVQSCYDYSSEGACEADNLKCNVGPCEWVQSEAYGEVGKGVCRSTSPELQDCSRCMEDQEQMYNACSRDKCVLYGECYYKADRGACVGREEASCVDYGTNLNDCAGAERQEVETNVVWSTQDCQGNDCQKIGLADQDEQANILLQQSADLLGLGTCEIGRNLAGQQVCIKDADNNNAIGSDCRVTDARCNRDKTPPTTTLNPQTKYRDGKPLFGRTSQILVTVRDDIYTPAEAGGIVTRWCLVADGSTCYPTDGIAANAIDGGMVTEGAITFTAPDAVSGAYTIFFFSEDFSKNLEPVQELEVLLDTVPPQITITSLNSDVLFTDREWYTNVSLTLTAQDNLGAVRCSARLLLDGLEIQPFNNIQNEYGSSWSRTYFNIEDGLYKYNYTCQDEAGNVVAGIHEVDIAADPSITDPLPTGTLGRRDSQPFSLSVRTNPAMGPAVCRIVKDSNFVFDEAEKADNYFVVLDPANGVGHAMTPNNDGTQHFYQYSPGEVTQPHIFNVKCQFPDGTIAGNRADRIIFSTDYAAPTVSLVSCADDIPFDTAALYGEAIQVCLVCNDDATFTVPSAGDPESLRRSMEPFYTGFGCQRMDYCLSTTSDTICDALTDDKSSPIRLSSTATIHYTGLDRGGNEADGVVTIIIDTKPPEFTVTVRPNQDMTSPGLEAIGYGEYFFFIESDKDIKDIENNPLPTLVVHGREEEHQFDLTLINSNARLSVWQVVIPPAEDLDELQNGRAELTVAAEDVFGHRVEDEFLFTFRTTGPREPMFEPLLDGVEAPDGTDYPNYPLYYRRSTDTYYTNQPTVYLTGRTQDPPLTLSFYVNNRAQPQFTYDQLMNADSEPAGIERRIATAANAGDTVVYLDDPNNLAIRETFVPGNFVRFTNHERTQYGAYRHYYEIVSAQIVSPGTESSITLAEPLEQDLPFGSSPVRAQAFTKRTPANWFGGSVELQDGENKVFLRAKDRMNNPSRPTKEYLLYHDPYPPQVVRFSPEEGTTGDVNAPITLRLKERLSPGSLLDLDQLTFRFNGQVVQRRNLRITNDSNSAFIYYNITYNSSEPLNGTYTVNVTGWDWARNSFNAAWQFTVDPNLPKRPVFTVHEARQVDDKWYTTDGTPSFTLDFSEDLGKVYLRRIGLRGQLQSPDVDCIESARNIFDCLFTDSLLPTFDAEGKLLNDEFNVVVSAYKVLDDGTVSGDGEYPNNFIIVDNLPPEIVELVDFVDYVRDNQNFTIKLRINNELHGVDAVLRYQEVDYPLVLLSDPSQGTPTHEFLWQIPAFPPDADIEQYLPFTITVIDYVGNSDSISDEIYFDRTPPDITSFIIEVLEAPVRDLATGYFATRYTTISVRGTFRDSDVTGMWTEPGSYNVRTHRYGDRAEAEPHLDTVPPSFQMQLIINGPLNEETLNQYQVFLEDRAGHFIQKPMTVLADLKAPTVTESRIS